jgi:hypothetical protein
MTICCCHYYALNPIVSGGGGGEVEGLGKNRGNTNYITRMWRVLQERRNSKKLETIALEQIDESSETIIAYYVVVQKTTKTSFYRGNTA